MQKFSYHTHTNSFGVYDGHNSATEMIAAAEAAGYTELGISNHLICKKGISRFSPQFFDDFKQAETVYLKTIDEIRTAAQKYKIKVYVGFEVDYFKSIKKLINGIPIQHITHIQEFMKMEFYVDSNVLIPRPDTEVLVEEVIRIAKKINNPVILDLCTGSGAIGISIAKYVKDAKVYASDISEKALEIAKKSVKAVRFSLEKLPNT